MSAKFTKKKLATLTPFDKIKLIWYFTYLVVQAITQGNIVAVPV